MQELMPSIMEYLEAEYLSLSRLAKTAKITTDRVKELEETQCIPGHSYAISRAASVICTLKGAYTENSELDKFYNPSIVKWIERAESLAKDLSLTDVAMQIRNEFNQEFNKVFGHTITPGCKGLDHAWRYFINGTWGICLKDISIACMANKEMSRLKIASLVKMNDAAHELSKVEKLELQEAVNTYESATKLFPPHLLPTCSRTCEVEPAVRKYLLD